MVSLSMGTPDPLDFIQGGGFFAPVCGDLDNRYPLSLKSAL